MSCCCKKPKAKLPRKLGALYVMAALVVVCAFTIAPAALSTIVTALVALYGAFVTGHAATDVMASKAPAPTKDDEDPESAKADKEVD